MKRWKKVLIWTLSVIVVLGVGGLFAANYAVDKLMNSMAGGFDVDNDDAASVPQGQVVEPVVASSSEQTASPDPASTSLSVSPSASSNAGEGKYGSSGTTNPSNTPAQTSEGVDGIAHISKDKAKEVQESVSMKDKADVASIVLQQLSVSDIKRLQELAKGGLTIEEKREARSIILGKVSEEQYNELSQIAKKYGVSQGKTREQVIAGEERIKAKEKGSE
ncbi:hypothetical protein [Paenibacillus sp. MMS20-IR301]|uniref:hypothetical protein n=1 Tax=Paenibacillus sp. MMS20-IR301 TaxID=2895946 RepID=UPI0028E488BC|nr:hypothetical protein [Paenibacillus sp. MMS20-IR301]WNS43521.1 hypothetical protein LOS79_32070 [Paenibacillus sp. MMS20-IR301]